MPGFDLGLRSRLWRFRISKTARHAIHNSPQPGAAGVNAFLPKSPGLDLASIARLNVTPVRGSRPTTLRVLQLINGEHYAGAERVQDNLALRLPAEGVETTFVCVKPYQFERKRASQGTLLLNMPMRNRMDVRPALRVAKLIEREGFDLIHTHTPRTAMLGNLAARYAGVPFVHHVHGQTATEVNAGWKQRLVTKVENHSIVKAAAVIAVSPTAGTYLSEHGIPAERVVVIPNGIIAPQELPERSPPEPGDAWTLGIIGLLRPRKGLEVLLRAIAALRRQGRRVSLRAVGPFETEGYHHEVLRLTTDLGLQDAVDWRGFQQDIAGELAAMDAFVFPSILPEGMPMVLLEAMGHGTPIVASEVPGVVDCLTHRREALLVPPDQPEKLAAAVEELISGAADWRALRQAARARQQAEFSVAAMAARVAEVYRRVLANN